MRKLRNYDIQTLAIAVGIAICLGFAGYWLATAIQWIPYANQIDYGEGYNMYITKLWANGGWNWDISQEPYLTLMYGPIFFMIMKPLINTFGLSFEIGRAVMAIATVISCVFCGLIVYQISKRKLLAAFAGLLPLVHPIVRDWGVQARVDPLAIMFSIIGIWWMIRFEKSRWFWATPLFLVASFYTKVNIVGVIAAVIFLVLCGNWRRMLAFSSICAGLTFIPLIAFRPLFDHMFTYNNQPMWQNIIAMKLPDVLMFVVPIIGILLVATMYTRKRFKTLPCIWMITAIVTANVLLLKHGSSTNYYIESIYTVSTCAVLSIPMLAEYAKKHLQWQSAAVWIIAIMTIPTLSPSNLHIIPFPNTEYTRAVSEVQAIIADTKEPIPTENAGAVVMAGKDLLIEPLLFTRLANTGMWDESTYVDDVKNQRFDYLVLRSPLEDHVRNPGGHFSAAVSAAMVENYTLIYNDTNELAWWYIFNVYESNSKLANDERPIVNGVVNE